MYKFYEMQQIQSSISIALRKKSGAVTAANVRDNSFVDSLVQHDDGFHILKGLRSAPAHWEAEKKSYSHDKTIWVAYILHNPLCC